MYTSIESSGENLLSFMNSASSCVKTVLSKPGSFKRNTNHRRFLQKQLRQQQTEASVATAENQDKKSFIINKTVKKTITKTKSRILQRKKTKAIEACQRVPSPTVEYTQTDTSEESIFYPDTYIINHKQNYSVSPVEYVTDTSSELYNILSNGYCRSDSSSSYASSEEDFGYSDFLSGEDLVRSLDITDLFVPEKSTHGDMVYEQYDFIIQEGKNTFTEQLSEISYTSFEDVFEKYCL